MAANHPQDRDDHPKNRDASEPQDRDAEQPQDAEHPRDADDSQAATDPPRAADELHDRDADPPQTTDEHPRAAKAGSREESAGPWHEAGTIRVRLVHQPADKAGKDFYGDRRMVTECLEKYVFGPVVPIEVVARVEVEALKLGRTEWRDKDVVRRVDLLWRASFRDSWLYVLFPFEVQAKEDWTMPVRVLVTTALIYAELCKDADVRKRRVLPPVVPVVVYGGRTPWKSARDLADLLPPEAKEFLPYALGQRFVFVPEAEEAAGLKRADTPRSATLLLRYTREQERFLEALEALKTQVPQDSPLRRAALEWVRVAMIKRGIKEEDVAKLKELEDLESPMVEALWDHECRIARREGREEGLERGRREAEARARREQRAVLRQRVERKFGLEAAAELGGLLERVAGPAEALDIAMSIADCDTAEDFVAQMRRKGRQG